MYDTDSTITAVSTPPQLSAIAIIRISGKKTFEIVNSFFKPLGKKTAAELPLRYAATGQFVHNGRVIDEVILIKFKQPNSYTGEDSAEIHSHGSPFITAKIIEAISEFEGARLAQRGEFTYRAFLNGKLDLTQAEAVLQVIESKSQLALDLGLAQLKGKLSDVSIKWKEKIIELLSELEVAIDHSDEEIASPREKIATKLEDIASQIKSALAASGELLNIDIPVVIIGKPNVGKSSLFNALAGDERVIVTHLSGTTTDIVSETVRFGGLSWKIHDTAGIGTKPADIIEELGQDKTHKKLAESQLILFTLDASEELDGADFQIIEKIIRKKNAQLIVVLNKSDLNSKFQQEKLVQIFEKSVPSVSVSSKMGKGISELKEMMRSLCVGNISSAEEILIGTLRQKKALKNCLSSLELAINEIQQSEEIVAHHIRIAAEELRELTGEIVHEDILEQIFSNFCIGK